MQYSKDSLQLMKKIVYVQEELDNYKLERAQSKSNSNSLLILKDDGGSSNKSRQRSRANSRDCSLDKQSSMNLDLSMISKPSDLLIREKSIKDERSSRAQIRRNSLNSNNTNKFNDSNNDIDKENHDTNYKLNCTKKPPAKSNNFIVSKTNLSSIPNEKSIVEKSRLDLASLLATSNIEIKRSDISASPNTRYKKDADKCSFVDTRRIQNKLDQFLNPITGSLRSLANPEASPKIPKASYSRGMLNSRSASGFLISSPEETKLISGNSNANKVNVLDTATFEAGTLQIYAKNSYEKGERRSNVHSIGIEQHSRQNSFSDIGKTERVSHKSHSSSFKLNSEESSQIDAYNRITNPYSGHERDSSYSTKLETEIQDKNASFADQTLYSQSRESLNREQQAQSEKRRQIRNDTMFGLAELKAKIHEKEQEVEEIKNKRLREGTEIQNLLLQIKDMVCVNKKNTDHIDQLKEVILRKDFEIAQCKASREKLEQTVQDLKDCLAKTERDRAQENLQVIKLERMVDSKSDEIKNLFEKLEEIQSESQRSVDHEVKKLSTDNKNLKDKILNYQQKMQIWELEIQKANKMKSDYGEIETKIQDLEGMQNILIKENEALKNKLARQANQSTVLRIYKDEKTSEDLTSRNLSIGCHPDIMNSITDATNQLKDLEEFSKRLVEVVKSIIKGQDPEIQLILKHNRNSRNIAQKSKEDEFTMRMLKQRAQENLNSVNNVYVAFSTCMDTICDLYAMKYGLGC